MYILCRNGLNARVLMGEWLVCSMPAHVYIVQTISSLGTSFSDAKHCQQHDLTDLQCDQVGPSCR